jgi:hypothetical protein
MFKVGDKVKHIQGEGTVVYGPFEGLTGFEPRYLVERSDGVHFTGGESYLTLVPKFEVGQKVTFQYSSTEYEVVSGPYPDEGETFWVYKDGKGNHGIAYEVHMIPVAK